MDALIKKMITAAYNALPHAYAPYSQFQVAACICTEEGTLYTGVNVENASFGLTLCAEASAIANMVSDGARKIKQIVILAGNNELCAPCGACRQRLIEFSSQATAVHLCNHTSLLQTVAITELLPLAFNFKPQQD